MTTPPPRRARKKQTPMPYHIAAAVLIAGAGAAFILAPPLLELAPGGSLDARIRDADIRSLEDAITAWSDRDAAARAIPADVQSRIAEALPPLISSPDLVVLLDGFAKRAGVEMRSVKFEEDRRAGAASAVGQGAQSRRIQVSLGGVTYERLKTFIMAVEKSARLMSVQAVAFSPDDGAASLTITAFFFTERP